MDNLTTSIKNGIPMPIVTLNRSILAFGILIAILSQNFWITTILFLILLPATLLGKHFSIVFWFGNIIFKKLIETAEVEDPRLQRFNNTIATSLLGLAQVAFLATQPIIAWIFAGTVMVASGVALMGFCVGCFLYYQFNLQRYRFFKS